MEQFSIPGAGAIIVKMRHGIEHILLQDRDKEDAPNEAGLLEIPAGKIRAFESVYDTLRREVKEETGLDITNIEGEDTAATCISNGYKVLNFKPFSCSQNIEGTYPIMVFTFICHAQGTLLEHSNEAKNFRWVSKQELYRMLSDTPERFYPMHRDTLLAFIENK